MDYNLPIMLPSSNPSARLRLTLITIILATIPCYCLGGIAVMLAPDSSATATPTETPFLTATQTLQIPTASPGIITSTASNTPTVTPSPTNTLTPSFTPSPTFTITIFVPPSNTPTNTATITPTFTPSNTPTVTNTFTPTNTQTPSITPFPTTSTQ